MKVIEVKEIAPGLMFPVKCQETEVTEGYPTVVHTFTAENVSLRLGDQSVYPAFRFPPNAEIADYIERRLYRLTEDGQRVPILRNGEPVRLQWIDFEKDEVSSPVQQQIRELSSKVRSQFNPWRWLWAAVGFSLAVALFWVWYRRNFSNAS